MILPIVNLNGTSREELRDQQFKALRSLLEAREVLCDAAPHGRDYQLNPPGAFHQAQQEFADRLVRLDAIIAEYNQIVRHLV